MIKEILHVNVTRHFLQWSSIGIALTFLLAGLMACRNNLPKPVWHDLTPGVSTTADVLRELGEPTYKFDDSTTSFITYVYGTPDPSYMVSYMVVFQGKIIKLIQVHDISSTTGKMVDRYGEPDRVTWPTRNNPCGKRLFIYAQQGVAVVADNLALKGATFEWFYFEPQSVNDFLAAFVGNVLPAQNPCTKDTYPEDFWKR